MIATRNPFEYDEVLQVKISNTDEILWQGGAKAVSSENNEGPFDILPYHANFITIINNKPIIIRMEDYNENKIFKFETSVIYTHDSIVNIYADIK